MACFCSQYNACSDWLIVASYSSVMPMGRLWACKDNEKSYQHNKQHIDLECLVFTEKYQISALLY